MSTRETFLKACRLFEEEGNYDDEEVEIYKIRLSQVFLL